jgi:hypothetical protein
LVLECPAGKAALRRANARTADVAYLAVAQQIAALKI